jgi:tetratricopeptide (TPR) repeat protein
VYTAYQFLYKNLGVSGNPSSGISEREKNNADPDGGQLKLKGVYIAGILVIAAAIGILFAISPKMNTGSKSPNLAAGGGDPKVVAQVPADAASAVDLFNNAIALCSAKKCVDPIRAIEYLDQAIRMKPDYAEAYGMRGNVYSKCKHYEKAIENYNEVIRLRPDDSTAYFNRGYTYLKQNNVALCCSDAQKACKWGNCQLLENMKRRGYCR